MKVVTCVYMTLNKYNGTIEKLSNDTVPNHTYMVLHRQSTSLRPKMYSPYEPKTHLFQFPQLCRRCMLLHAHNGVDATIYQHNHEVQLNSIQFNSINIFKGT